MHVISCLKTSIPKIIMGVALSAVLANPAFAIDSNTLVSRIQEMMQQNDLVMTTKGIDADEKQITLHGVSISAAAPDSSHQDGDRDEAALFFGDVVLSQIEEGADGSYLIRKVTAGSPAPLDNSAQKGEQLVVEGVEASDVYLSPAGANYQLSQHLPYGHLLIRKIAFEYDGKTIAALENNASFYSTEPSGGVIKNVSSIGSFLFDPSAIPGEDGQQLQKNFADLGYNKIEGNMHLASAWDPVQGGWNLPNIMYR